MDQVSSIQNYYLLAGLTPSDPLHPLHKKCRDDKDGPYISH